MLLRRFPIMFILFLCLFLLGLQVSSDAQSAGVLGACEVLAFSSEEDFVTQGPEPSDGNPIISDGDLLGPAHAICARNRELLTHWQLEMDLGLDAVDIIDVERELVAFSTELDDPQGRFRAGDLLATNGTVIPNEALLSRFQVDRDLELDGVHFVGTDKMILAFLEEAASKEPSDWLDGNLVETLTRYKIDIWISTEGTELTAASIPILDGTLLAVRSGVIMLDQPALLPLPVPAGIPARGVDFGLDAVSAPRIAEPKAVHFSTEILYRDEFAFNDGDILRSGNGVAIPHVDLIEGFEPLATFVGIDALFMRFEQVDNMYLPVIRASVSPSNRLSPFEEYGDMYLPVIRSESQQ